MIAFRLSSTADSLLWWPESQQQIPRFATLESDVTRGDVHHPIDDGGARRTDGSALSRNAVHRLYFLRRIVLPKRFAIEGGEGSQRPVQPRNENHSGSHAHRSAH